MLYRYHSPKNKKNSIFYFAFSVGRKIKKEEKMDEKNMANNIKNRIIELERYTLKDLLKVSEKIYCKK